MENVKFLIRENQDPVMISVIGGTGVGKTEFVLNMARDIMNYGMDVIYFNTDTKEDMLLRRLSGTGKMNGDGSLHLFSKINPTQNYVMESMLNALKCSGRKVGMVIYDMCRKSSDAMPLMEYIKNNNWMSYCVFVGNTENDVKDVNSDYVYCVKRLPERTVNIDMCYNAIPFSIEVSNGDGNFQSLNQEHLLNNGMKVYTY